MSHAEAQLAKERLLGVAVTPREHAVILDMAEAVKARSTTYSWGHDRLALAIHKRPGSRAAKSALAGRIIPSLIRKGIITKTADAHRGHRAEYDLLLLREDWMPASSPGMGTGSTGMGTGSEMGMGTGFEPEWVPVLNVMGTAQTGTPATNTPTITPTGDAYAESDARASAPHGKDPSQPRKTARRRRTTIPDGFAPNDEHIALARDKSVNLGDELANFRDWSMSKSVTSADWNAEFRKWLRSSYSSNRSRSRTKPAGELARDVLSIRLPGEAAASEEPEADLFVVHEKPREVGGFGIAR